LGQKCRFLQFCAFSAIFDFFKNDPKIAFFSFVRLTFCSFFQKLKKSKFFKALEADFSEKTQNFPHFSGIFEIFCQFLALAQHSNRLGRV